MELDEYDFTIEHIKGTNNVAADLLSRIKDVNNINFGLEYSVIMKKIKSKIYVMRKVGNNYFQCCFVPPKYRKQLIMIFHTKFHLGVNNTYNEIRKFCFWDNLYEDVR